MGEHILSSTDRLFRSIRTLQCGLTRRTLEAGIETRPTLKHSLTYIYIYIYIYILDVMGKMPQFDSFYLVLSRFFN